MEITFKTKNKKQVEAAAYWIDDTTQEILYGGGKGGGKSFLGASLIFGDALIYPGTQYFIARQELIDLRKFTVSTVHEVFKNFGLDFKAYCNLNGQDNVFNLKNGSKVYMISCKELPSDPLYERFGSMQMTRGWIEEGGEVAENAKANLWLSIGRWKNEEYNLPAKLLITANPKKGWMKREFIDPWKQGNLPAQRKFIQALATDNAYLPEAYVQKLSEEKDVVRRQRLFEGNWDYDEDKDSLISIDALEDSFSNTISKNNEKYMTIDVARQGEDSTVFTFWEDLELIHIERRQKQSTEVTKQNAKDFATRYQIPWSHIMVDEDGIGGAVVDGMPGVRGFVANSTPLATSAEIRGKISKIDSPFTPKTNFTNLKTQCAFKLAELINEHKLAMKVPEYRDQIVDDLNALLRHKNADSDGKLQIKPKDKVKEELGHSPDIGDAIIFRAWFELLRDAKNEDPIVNEHVTRIQLNNFARNRNNQAINSSQ